MRTLVDRFCNATVAGFKDRALYISTIAYRGSLSRQRIKGNEYVLRIPDPQRWSFI